MSLPIFKKGNSSDPNNYRPISLTSVICKIFESIIKNQLLSYLNTFSLISKHQHGFLSKHSTSTNLLESLNDWTSSLDKIYLVKIIYFDFEKTFDSVSVPKLLYELRHFGIRGRLFSCIEYFLTNQSERVRVGNCISTSLPVISGVPQGNVLGPFLFLLFINHLSDIVDDGFHAKLFADDLKSYNICDYRVNPSAVQISLDSISAWAEEWQQRLSMSKCGSLLLTNNYWFEDETNLLLGIILSQYLILLKIWEFLSIEIFRFLLTLTVLFENQSSEFI